MFIYPIYNHNWRNISTIYIYNKTSIKRNILTINKIHREVGPAMIYQHPGIYLCSSFPSSIYRHTQVQFSIAVTGRPHLDVRILHQVSPLRTHFDYNLRRLFVCCVMQRWPTECFVCNFRINSTSCHSSSSFNILSNDRSKAYSKMIPSHSAI